MSEKMVVYNWTIIHPNMLVEQDARIYGSCDEALAKARLRSLDTRDEIRIFEDLIEIDSILAYRMMRGFAGEGYGHESIQNVLSSKQLVLCATES